MAMLRDRALRRQPPRRSFYDVQASTSTRTSSNGNPRRTGSMTDEQTVARVRLFIFERFLADAQTPVVEELMTEFSLSRDEVTAVLDDLVAARHIALVPG